MNKLVNFVKKYFPVISMYFWFFALRFVSAPVSLAADGDVPIIGKLKTFLTGFVAALGAVFVVIGVYKYAVAHKDGQQNREHEGVNWIVSGGIMIAIGSVLTALGV